MKRTTRRAGAAAAAALGGTLFLTGCQAHPGQAAVVGDQTISTKQLQGVLSRSLAQSDCGKTYSGQPVVLERVKLSDLILGSLLDQVADRLGVPVSQADVDSELQAETDVYGGRRTLELQASGSGAIAPADLDASVRTRVLEQKIEDKLTATVQVSDRELRSYYGSHTDQYSFGHARDMVVTDKATADSLVKLIKGSPDSFGELLRKQADDQQAAGQHAPAGSEAQLGAFVGLNPKSVIDAGGLIGLIPLSQLAASGFATTPGSVFAIQLSNGWNVVQIVDNQTFDDVKQQVRRDMLAQQRQQALQQALDAQVKRTPVHVNPRYGRWDAGQHTVVAASDATVKQAAAPATRLQCGQGQGQGG